MAYCTPSDVRSLIPLIDQSMMSDDEMTKFITKAEAYVDGKLRDTYNVPFNPAPDLIRDVTAEYSAYLVLRTVYFQNSPNMTEFTKELRDSAEQILKDLADGELNLESPQTGDGAYPLYDDERVFSLEDITPFRSD
jgi:phage gp36-like protein